MGYRLHNQKEVLEFPIANIFSHKVSQLQAQNTQSRKEQKIFQLLSILLIRQHKFADSQQVLNKNNSIFNNHKERTKNHLHTQKKKKEKRKRKRKMWTWQKKGNTFLFIHFREHCKRNFLHRCEQYASHESANICRCCGSSLAAVLHTAQQRQSLSFAKNALSEALCGIGKKRTQNRRWKNPSVQKWWLIRCGAGNCRNRICFFRKRVHWFWEIYSVFALVHAFMLLIYILFVLIHWSCLRVCAFHRRKNITTTIEDKESHWMNDLTKCKRFNPMLYINEIIITKLFTMNKNSLQI